MMTGLAHWSQRIAYVPDGIATALPPNPAVQITVKETARAFTFQVEIDTSFSPSLGCASARN
jgi:hypothetical protein